MAVPLDPLLVAYSISDTLPYPTSKAPELFPLVVHIHAQVRNQGLFRAGEVSWNEGTSINILSSTYQRKTLKGKLLEFFLLHTFKTAFQMGHLNHRWTQSGYFFLKQGYFFSIFNKG